ncbi:MAG: hypothetical protein ACYDC5_07600 [Candidatus Dormibacteria bacterium]
MIATDEFEEDEFGQRVAETFPLADVFVDPSDDRKDALTVASFIELLFGSPYLSPGPEELAMFHAYVAAARSASMSRQVGAAIVSPSGDLIATGTNEVPKAFGGQYWQGDIDDHRDHVGLEDRSDRMLLDNLAEVLQRLQSANWLAAKWRKLPSDDLASLALMPPSHTGSAGPLRGAKLLNVIEYVRAVHAEMAAITNCALRGVSTDGATLATTTFPCHDCAKHIVAAGVRVVVFVDPYPKSLVQELYKDSIAVGDPAGGATKVHFRPFIGLAPALFWGLYRRDFKRKREDGKVLNWPGSHPIPRLPMAAHNFTLETFVAEEVQKVLM